MKRSPFSTISTISSYSWATTTTHATTRLNLLSLSHRHGGLKITSVRTFSVHLRPLHTHSPRATIQTGSRLRACFSQVSSWSPGTGYYAFNTLSPPPLTYNGMLHRILAWPSLLLGLSAWINQHPLRTREGSTPPIGNLMYWSPSLVSHLRP
jgi:hypothetical protein